jgi:hypothetical protein
VAIIAKPGPYTYIGLFLTTLSLLQLELFLTRIFSVTMWYHFAFMAISLAMFGLAAGAVLVEMIKTKEKPNTTLTRTALLFAFSSAVCFVAQLYIEVNPEREILNTALAFVIIAVPFVFAGMTVCVALTRFPRHTGSLYAADLAGSAAGCVLTIPILDHIHAPTAVLLNAGIAALGALFFACDEQPRGLPRARVAVSAVLCAALILFGAVNLSARLVDIRWIKGGRNYGGGLYEKWNALSRIHVRQNDSRPFGWGLSPRYTADHQVAQLYLNIDSGAATVITKFDGNIEPLQHLKYDVTALAHYLRQDTSVLVIGVGGGRDILTSLVFGQRHVTGVEINPDILDVLSSRFAEFAGNLQKRPAVTLVHDEARSYVARSKEQFGIIQASLIDTWAATSAGAYVLTENGLYTKEAWVTFLNHLTPDGILTMSRWYYEAQPAETLRLAGLATAALTDAGVDDPRQHIIIVRKQDSSESGQYSVATILVSKRPFTAEEVDRVDQVSRSMEFVPVLTPKFAELHDFEAVASRSGYLSLIQSYPLNIAAPTDDSPFFFHMLRAADLLKPSTYQGMNEINLKAVKVLGTLLAIVTGLSLTAIVLPMLVRPHVRDGQTAPMVTYFAAIGLAFMMVEIGQLERLIVFLGHPIYGLTVVLFVLLLASSLGSLMSDRFGKYIWLLPLLLITFVVGSPLITNRLIAEATWLRILVSAVLLFPSGFFMGMAFPVGMKHVRRREGAPAAWYWGINGAFSVISSVLAVVVAVFWGITATLLVGVTAYVVALLCLRSGRNPDLVSTHG